MDQIRVGSITLAEYTYSEDANRYLEHMDYGNGDYQTYGYDSYDRMTRTGYEDENIPGEYQYSSDGYLGRVTDHFFDRVTKYLYDLSGRSAGYELTGENFSQKVSYGYDALGPSSFTLNTARYCYLRNMQGDIVGILNANCSDRWWSSWSNKSYC